MTSAPPHPAAASTPGAQLDLDVAIIACNNALTIARTIESITPLAQRIIVVDSGSTDETVKIAAQLNADVINHPWQGHVKQKQFALEQCTASWVLSLDSDESPDRQLLDSITAAVEKDDHQIDGYSLNRRIFFHDAFFNHTFQPEFRLRLVRRNTAHWQGLDPHDQLILKNKPNGKPPKLQGILRHDSWQDIAELFSSQIRHGIHAAETYHQDGKRATTFQLITSPLSTACKQIILRRAFLDGWRGITCALAASLGVTAKYARLLELQNTKTKETPQDQN